MRTKNMFLKKKMVRERINHFFFIYFGADQMRFVCIFFVLFKSGSLKQR